MWFVYILRCSDGSLYIGETNNVANRLARHNDGIAATYTAMAAQCGSSIQSDTRAEENVLNGSGNSRDGHAPRKRLSSLETNEH